VKTISIPDTSDTVELFIYDSSGQDLYNNCLSKYVSNNNVNSKRKTKQVIFLGSLK
jgi:hypothetical protein